MADATSTGARFHMYRERAGISENEVAREMGISSFGVYDIENYNDLSSCYSPRQVKAFCRVVGIHPYELFGVEIEDPPISASELVKLIHEQCRLRNLTLEQFEDVVGWRLSACIDPPEKLLEDITIDGLQWLCIELGVDWHRTL